MKYPRKIWLLLAGVFLLACSLSNYLPAGGPAPADDTGSIADPILPTPTATLLPTPVPTPVPAIRIELGDKSRFEGDWEEANTEFQTALDSSPDLEVQSAALLGIGRSRHQAGDYEGAISALQSLIESYPQSSSIPYAYFALAQANAMLGRHGEAAEAYSQYLNLRPGYIDAYVLNLRGDQFDISGDYTSAIRDYRAALQSPSQLNGLLIEIEIAQAHAATGDYETALGMYQDIYNRAQTDFTKAQMDYQMGQAYTALGKMEQAYAVYQDAVFNFPTMNSAYLSLIALVDAGVPVDELQRGIVDYHAGQHGVALAAFDRYFQAGGPEQEKARYYNGLALRALGGYESAITEWEKVIQNFPDSPYWDDAWEQKSFTQWFDLHDYGGAIQTLLDFVETAADHPRAAELLYIAAQIAESDSRLDQAAQIWERVAMEYPEYDLAQRALHLAGISYYRLGNFGGALGLFQRVAENAFTLEDRVAAHFWQGKAYSAMGDIPAATAAWEMAASLDPTGYYSERAGDILRQKPPFTPPQNIDLSFDLDFERIQAEAWMRSTFDIPAETDLMSPGPLWSDPVFQRGTELWELGLYEEARDEFESLRQSVEFDAANSFRLTNYLLELGFYRSAILAARQVLNLAGMSDLETMNAPVFFNHIRFGTYFSDIVLPAAHGYNIHPLLLYSIVRQESAFEGFARSGAGAQGLMQIMPATGQEIASNLGWPEDYSNSDLNRPIVSLVLGADYLAKWRDYFDGDLYAALAAYNGGPGNAMEWKQLAQDDLDLFLEVIRFEETRDYIRKIYENFNIYRRIYDRTP